MRSVLDVNGGVAGGDEVADLAWLIDTVMSVTDTQLMVDSAGPQALDAGVRAVIDKGGGGALHQLHQRRAAAHRRRAAARARSTSARSSACA